MAGESGFTCLLIGQESLLILCGEDLLARGHAIRAVATESDEIAKWAAGRGLAVISCGNESLVTLLSEKSCDYLFSIINYRVLPEEILRLPRRGAINFHDGPLPGYAGMYVTSWAIMNGEREHGISWHWMTKGIDAGSVLKEKRFPLSGDETALTLNTKCYEAGFDAFRSLLTDLEQGTTEGRSQEAGAPGGYYALRKRPVRMATLGWSRPAHELDALHRSLDFGRYKNPLGCAKVAAGETVLIPRRLTVLERDSIEPPGTFERQGDPQAVVVHTATKMLELADFVTLDGAPVDLSALAASHRFEGGVPAALDQLLQTVCVHESFWAARLVSREPVPLPYAPGDVRRDQSPVRRLFHDVASRSHGEAETGSSFEARVVAAISLYLGRLSGKNAFDLDYQAPLPAHAPRETARYFARSVPLRVRLDWTAPFTGHVERTVEALAEIRKRGTYARDLVLRFPQLTQEHRQKLREIPDVAVGVYANFAEEPLELPNAELAFLIWPAERTIRLAANADVFDQRLLSKIAEELGCLLSEVGDHPQCPLADAPVVGLSDQALLERWNDATRVDYEPASVPSMFEAQVERSPDATALVFRGHSTSYRQLNRRANQLANLLIARGVKGGDLVGVLMDRSVEMVVSLYAVLKTGAAYVPLDPAYPAHRLAIMVEDARPALILTQTSRLDQLNGVAAERLAVDGPGLLEGLSTEAPSVAIKPNDVAYVMYTSGSTGRPKGAQVTHGNIQNFFLTLDRQLAGQPRGTWLAVTSISFDISIPELFWTLTRGAQVVLRGSPKADQPAPETTSPEGQIDFSLFFRNALKDNVPAGEHDRMMTEAAKFAAEHGFAIRPALHAGAVQKPAGPDPVQLAPSLTSDNHPDTYRCAGRIGSNVLTPLVGQSLASLAKNIALYRKSWKEAGHAGEGRVTVLAPTFIGTDDRTVKDVVRGAMKAWLKKESTLVREAAWEFPAFQKICEESGQTLDRYLETMSDTDLNDLLEFAFERSFATGGLFGSQARCLATVKRLKEIGVDEVACLIDFGMPPQQILERLPELGQLKLAANAHGTDEDPDDIASLIERHGVTHFQCTPSRAASLMWDPRTRRAMGNLKLMVVGGEAMSEELGRQLRSVVPGRVFNVYGPTETTVWSTMHELKEIDGPVPIGKPIANTQLYVVDERQKCLPVGVPGELLIGGDGVGRGYLSRPDLTAARFLARGKSTVYRTGDLVRLTPDGAVEFLGRLDDQVKIRGHRIELGEIEAVIETHPAVRKAVVHPQDDAAGGKRLVAFVVPRASSGFSAEELRDFVQDRLPEFMVPSLFESLNELPLTPSGKVDRRALPKASFRPCRKETTQKSAPVTDTERRLIELWQTLLEVPQVDRSDNFFELGGHSLLGMRAVSKIHETFGVRLSTKTFLVSSLAKVAAEIDRLSAAEQSDDAKRPAVKAAGSRRFPLWFMSRGNAGQPKGANNRR